MSDVEGPQPPIEDYRTIALAAVAATLADDSLGGLTSDLQRVCRAAVRVLDLKGSAIHLVSGDGELTSLVAADDWSRVVAEKSIEAGEGPSIDAHALARPVLAGLLLEPDAARWPGYVDLVRACGVRACFALPLHVGAMRLGVLDLFSTRSGNLDDDSTSMALTFSDLAVECLLEAPGGSPGSGDLDERLLDALERSEIHQAQGMVMVDRGVDLATALALMRAHAFAENIWLSDLAREIVAGGRLPDDEGR